MAVFWIAGSLLVELTRGLTQFYKRSDKSHEIEKLIKSVQMYENLKIIAT